MNHCEDIEKQRSHAEQSIFISFLHSDNWQKVREKNKFQEDSLWSETQSMKKQGFIHQNDPQYITSQEKNEQKSNLEVGKCENTFTLSMNSQQRSSEDLQLQQQNKDEYKKGYQNLSLGLLQINSGVCQKSRSLVATQGEIAQKGESIDNISIFQSQIVQQVLELENNTYLGTYSNKKAQSTMLLHNPKDIFFQKLAFLAKIKIKMDAYLKRFTNIYKTRLLNNKIRSYISDYSDILSEGNGSNRSLFSSLGNIQFPFFPVFDAHHDLCFFLQLSFIVLNYIYFVTLSLFTVFQVNNEIEKGISSSVSLLWIIEIIFNANSKTYSDHKIASDRQSLFLIYLRSQFFYDIIPLFFTIISQDPHIQDYLKILFQVGQFIKLLNLNKKSEMIQQQLYMRYQNYWSIQIFKMIINVFLVSHAISLLWYLIVVSEIEQYSEAIPWIQNDFDSHKWWRIYVFALYWSLTLLSNNGSNFSLTPLSNLFTIVAIIVNFFTYGYMIYTVCSFMHQSFKKNYQSIKDIQNINSYMQKQEISRNLQIKVNQSLEHYQSNLKHYEEQKLNTQILNNIPTHLREEIAISQNLKYLKKIKCLANKCSLVTLEKLSLFCEEVTYLPNEIFYSDLKDDKQLIYIKEGQVDLLYQDCKEKRKYIPYESLSVGDSFGSIGFFSGEETNCIAKSIKYTKVLKIKRSDFINIIKCNEVEFQKFCEVKDQILMYKNYSDIGIQCRICNKSTHLTRNCEIMNISKGSFYHRIQAIQQSVQQRRNYKRRLTFHHNSLGAFLKNQYLAYVQQIRMKQEQVAQRINLNSLSSIQKCQIDSQDFEDDDDQDWGDVQEVIIEDGHTQKELEACNKTYGSYLKSEIQSQYIRKRHSLQSNKLIPSSINEFEDQMGIEKRLNKMGTLDNRNFQGNDYLSQSSFRENTNFDSQRMNKDIDGSRKIRERKELVQNSEQNEDNYSHSKKTAKSIMKKQSYMNNKSFSKLFLEVDNNQSEYLKLNDKRKLLSESYYHSQKKINNNNTPILSPSNFSQKNVQSRSSKHEIITYYDPWQFDLLKDYEYYFIHGNSNIILSKMKLILDRHKVKKKKK